MTEINWPHIELYGIPVMSISFQYNSSSGFQKNFLLKNISLEGPDKQVHHILCSEMQFNVHKGPIVAKTSSAMRWRWELVPIWNGLLPVRFTNWGTWLDNSLHFSTTGISWELAPMWEGLPLPPLTRLLLNSWSQDGRSTFQILQKSNVERGHFFSFLSCFLLNSWWEIIQCRDVQHFTIQHFHFLWVFHVLQVGLHLYHISPICNITLFYNSLLSGF